MLASTTVGFGLFGKQRGRCPPDPAPVTMAVLPDTLKGLDVVEISVGATAVIEAAIRFPG